MRSVQRWEAPGGEVPGPVQVAVEGMLRDKIIRLEVNAAVKQVAQSYGLSTEAINQGEHAKEDRR